MASQTDLLNGISRDVQELEQALRRELLPLLRAQYGERIARLEEFRQATEDKADKAAASDGDQRSERRKWKWALVNIALSTATSAATYLALWLLGRALS